MPAYHNRWSHTDNDVANRTDLNLWDRTTQVKDVTNNKNYRVHLRFLADIILVNFLVKIDLKMICTLETDMNKISESNAKITTVGWNSQCKNYLAWSTIYSTWTNQT